MRMCRPLTGAEGSVQGWAIIVHSIRQVTGNIGPALRISALLMAVQFVLRLWFSSLMPAELPQAPADDPEALAAALPPGIVPAFFAMIAALVVIGPWVAVAWHRYVLLDELGSGPVPRWDGRRWGEYLWAMLRVGLAALAIVTVLSLLGSLLVAGFGGGEVLATAVIAGVLVPALWAVNRLSLVMPAAALGERMGLAESWRLTQPGSTPILGATLMLFGLGLGLQVIVAVIHAGLPIIGIAAQFAASWLLFLIGLSLLTTLYGHYREGRPLVAP